jgi:hypothetical protein
MAVSDSEMSIEMPPAEMSSESVAASLLEALEKSAGASQRFTEKSDSFARYYIRLALWLLFFAAYIAVILLLKTETATRASAPPWYSWTKIPAAKNYWQLLWLFPPVALYVVWLSFIRRLLQKPMRDAIVLPIATIMVFAINAATAMIDNGPAAILTPFDRPGHEYFFDSLKIRSAISWLASYTAMLPSYGVHTRTHPPGATLFFYFIARWIAPGLAPAAWTAVAVTATAVVPFYLLARRLEGQFAATMLLGLYAVTPNLVLFGATSMDGVFLTCIGWTIYFLIRAILEEKIALAIFTGILAAISLMMTFATIVIAVPAAIFAIIQIAKTPAKFKPIATSLILIAAISASLLFTLFITTGFNWLDCLRAARHSDHWVMHTFTLALGRYIDISFDNLLAFLIGAGFVTTMFAASQMRWEFRQILSPKPEGKPHQQKLDLLSFKSLALATTIAILILSFAGLFTHETERIWLFFSPMLLMATVCYITRNASNDIPRQTRLLEWTMGALFLQTWLCQIWLYTMW